MTITYPVAFPTQPGIKVSKFTMDDAVAMSESPFSFEQQVYEHQGKRWMVEITMPVMKRLTAGAFIARMAQLKGMKGTFLLGDPDARTPQGVATGTPLVNGGTQVGDTLVTDGWTHSVTGILLAGDYIQLGSGSTQRMHILTSDANSDGSGNATLSIWPTLRGSPADDAAIVTSNCMTQFRLDKPFNWSANEASTYSITFSATEAL